MTFLAYYMASSPIQGENELTMMYFSSLLQRLQINRFQFWAIVPYSLRIRRRGGGGVGGFLGFLIENEQRDAKRATWEAAAPASSLAADLGLVRFRCASAVRQLTWPFKTNGIPFWLVGAPPIVYFSGDWDVHWGYGV